jgi:hypothetical protein
MRLRFIGAMAGGKSLPPQIQYELMVQGGFGSPSQPE